MNSKISYVTFNKVVARLQIKLTLVRGSNSSKKSTKNYKLRLTTEKGRHNQLQSRGTRMKIRSKIIKIRGKQNHVPSRGQMMMDRLRMLKMSGKQNQLLSRGKMMINM